MTVSEMRQILSDRGIQLTKSLGQNFLHDGNQLRRIVEAAHLSGDENVLEIGPGLGPLTELLLQKSGRVLAIEMDQRLVNFLEKRFNDPKLELVRGDGLQVVRDKTRDWSDWKLVANLPYSVASPILVELAENPNAPKAMTVTLQIEVAQRIQARAGDDDYGLLSLLLQVRYEPSVFFKIPAASFFPAPDVDSACITLQLRREPLLPIELLPKFKRIVKKAFSERRKMMMKLLKQEWPPENLQGCFGEIGLSPQVRAEAVSLEQFVALATCLTNNPA
ncbi:MAG TPA: 16S rRNA (adenine(1518)-N(6)/adenine(1519)-N(6))-dimethyltransferase RsmA [Verrucomicrobiae bacterium]|nr:16S rRNA (adenine(1518)-N(6)/adenine(1519)-N(6))-dimethyltransferase RsmA [Verrucomicrobiae bacterium]